MSRKSHADRIISDTSWNVVEFNGGAHLRINDVVDVWPRNQKWMPARAPQKAKHYADINQLRKIVREATAKKSAAVQKIATLPDKPKERQPVRQISLSEWMEKFA